MPSAVPIYKPASGAGEAQRWAFIRTATPFVWIGVVRNTCYGTPRKDGQKDIKYPVRKPRTQHRWKGFTRG